MLLIFSATQFASVLSDIGAPIIHAICYGKMFKRRSTGSGDRILLLDTATFHQSRTDDREIRIANLLYDIVSITSKGDSVELRVTSDEFETRLFNIVQQIRDAVKKAPGTHRSKQLQSWLLKLYCPDEAISNRHLPRLISSVYRMPVPPSLHAGIYNQHLQPPDLFI